MQIRAIPAAALTEDQIAFWSDAQEGNPLLDSPYFRPEFTQAVSAVREGVEVAVLEKGGIPIGYFPFQRASRSTGRPVGAPLSDFQALISREELVCEPTELLRACRLSAWHFDHLLASQACFGQFVRRRVESPHVDLSEGFEGYASHLRHRHKYLVAPRRKWRCMERECGPLRFEPHVADPAILSALFRWKSDQYRRTHSRDIFAWSWTRRLLEKLLEYRGASFSPMLSVLYAGKRVVAIHYGLRSGSVLHSWFPAYDRALARFSPGLLLFLEIFKASSALGIRRVDLGKGDGVHKHRYMSGSTFVLEGTLDAGGSVALLKRICRWAAERIRTSKAYAPIRAQARFVGNLMGPLDLY
jgi:CelD/BcsL family acetyltransferase involved in cellulose biosynthesis